MYGSIISKDGLECYALIMHPSGCNFSETRSTTYILLIIIPVLNIGERVHTIIPVPYTPY